MSKMDNSCENQLSVHDNHLKSKKKKKKTPHEEIYVRPNILSLARDSLKCFCTQEASSIVHSQISKNKLVPNYEL